MVFLIDGKEYEFDIFFTKRGQGIKNPNKYYKSEEKPDIMLLEITKTDGSKHISIHDSDQFDTISCANWKVENENHTSYVKNSRLGMIHRLIMGVQDVSWKDCVVDHINGNGLDNRVENLRYLSMSQSCLSKHQKGYIEIDYGFVVLWSENKKSKRRFFGNTKYGSKENAEKEAILFRKEMEEKFYCKI